MSEQATKAVLDALRQIAETLRAKGGNDNDATAEALESVVAVVSSYVRESAK